MNATYLGFAAAALALTALALAPLLHVLFGAAPRRDVRLACALLVGLPLVSVGLYALVGAPTLVQALAKDIAPARHDVDAMVAALAAKLQRNPQDAEGWYVLGRSYLDLERYAEALTALTEAERQAPKEARMAAAHAEALAMSRGNDLAGEPGQLIARALSLDPLEPKALELAGLAAFQAGDFAQAARHWRILERRLAVGSEQREEIAAAAADAEARAATGARAGKRK